MSSTKSVTDVGAGIQHVLEDQIRMREGAMKLMSACSTLKQALETSKNLLTINARILGLMSGLQRQKEQRVLQEYNKQRSSRCLDIVASDCCKGKIALSEIRVPLMWKDNVHFTGKTGDQSYYAFALIRCGEQVRETPLCEITSADTDMYFSEALIFEDLHPDFKMDFEIYYTVLTTAESVPSLRAPRPSISIRGSSRRQVHFSAPKFCLAGHVQLSVDDVKGCMVSKDLAMGAAGASGVAVLGDITEFPAHPLELWGQICCELAAQPQCMINKTISNSRIKVREEEEEIEEEGEKWIEYHGELYQCRVQCWKDPPVKSQNPIPDKIIHLKEDMEVFMPDGGGSETRVHISCASDPSLHHALLLHSSEEGVLWKNQLRREVRNLRMWKNACSQVMHIEENRKARISTPSNATFYEQINIGDEPLMAKRTEHNGLCNGDSNPTVVLPDFKISNKERDNGGVTSSPVVNGVDHVSLNDDVIMNDPPIINKDTIITEGKFLDATHADLISPKEKRVLAMDASPIATSATHVPSSPTNHSSSTGEVPPLLAHTASSPMDIEPSPTDIPPSPTDISPSPTDIAPSPTEIAPLPTDIAPLPTDIVPSPTDITPLPTDITPSTGIELAGVTIKVTDTNDTSDEMHTENIQVTLAENEEDIVEKKIHDLVEKVAESELVENNFEHVSNTNVSIGTANSESGAFGSLGGSKDGDTKNANFTTVTEELGSTTGESPHSTVPAVDRGEANDCGTLGSSTETNAGETTCDNPTSVVVSDIASAASAPSTDSDDVSTTLTCDDVTSTVVSNSTIISNDLLTLPSAEVSSTTTSEGDLPTVISQDGQTTVDYEVTSTVASEEISSNVGCCVTSTSPGDTSTIPDNEASSVSDSAEDSSIEAYVDNSFCEVTSTVPDYGLPTLLNSEVHSVVTCEDLSSTVSSTDVSSIEHSMVVSSTVASDVVSDALDSEAVSSHMPTDGISSVVSPETSSSTLASEINSSTVAPSVCASANTLEEVSSSDSSPIDLKSSTIDPESSSIDPEISTIDPEISTIDPEISTIDPESSSVDCCSLDIPEKCPLEASPEVSSTDKVPEIDSTTHTSQNVNDESFEKKIPPDEACRDCSTEEERNKNDSSGTSESTYDPCDPGAMIKSSDCHEKTQMDEIVDSGVDSNSDISSAENDVCDHKTSSPKEQGVGVQGD